MSKHHRLASVDFLRGFAALAVVFHHALFYDAPPSNPPGYFRVAYSILHHGQLGVPLFFVISGFCIHLNWARRYAESGQQGLDFLRFWKRRFHRLYPPYFIALYLSMGLVVASYLVGVKTLLV